MLNPAQDLKNALIQGNQDKALAAIKRLDNVNWFLKFTNPPREITPLLLASKTSAPEVVQALLDKGALTNVSDLKGRNALHFAQDANKLDNAKVLISHSPDLRIKGDYANGSTPLHEAAAKNQIDFLDCYLKLRVNKLFYPCDVDRKDNEQQTPLHKAVSKGHQEAVEKLLAYGADPDARDKNNESPFYYAQTLSVLSSFPPQLMSILRAYKTPSLFSLAAVAFFNDKKNKEENLLELEKRKQAAQPDFDKLKTHIEIVFNSKDKKIEPPDILKKAVDLTYAYEKHQKEIVEKEAAVTQRQVKYIASAEI